MAHSIYFIRDSLFFCLFEKAVSFADPGQLIRVLKYWALAFRGVGQHNCSCECAEVLVRWKYETPRKITPCIGAVLIHQSLGVTRSLHCCRSLLGAAEFLVEACLHCLGIWSHSRIYHSQGFRLC
ncbi:hypothetical protein K438DRAFT_194463 [Mycena galopus ATCC 62051]|nr:hypothetical protein K438DRAFT_194463 [Mycena galopus ATCC 62051]